MILNFVNKGFFSAIWTIYALSRPLIDIGIKVEYPFNMSNEVFESLCTNFLFLNCEDEKSKGPELNSLLNQLNDACHSTKSKIPHSVSCPIYSHCFAA